MLIQFITRSHKPQKKLLKALGQDHMPELKLKQLQYECATWKRSLSFMMEENVRLKNRISEILKDNFDNGLLENIESFQNKFVDEDTRMSLLRDDVAGLENLLLSDTPKKENNEAIEKKLKKVRTNIIEAEKQFSGLKLSFNNYLSKNM